LLAWTLPQINYLNLFGTLFAIFFFSAIFHSYGITSSSQEIIFVHVMFLCLKQTMMFMRRWSSPSWKKLDLKLILKCLLMALHVPHSKRDREWILIVSKFKFIISLVACSFTCILFQVSHFRLMFYVFRRNTQPFASPFVTFYAQNDFSIVPFHANHYLNL